MRGRDKSRPYGLCLAAAFLLALSLPASAGRLGQVLARGPYPHLKGLVLRQQTGNATAGAWAEPAAADWDGDGDQDLIVGSGYGDLLHFERRADGFLSEPAEMIPEPLSLTPLLPTGNPVSPSVADWDGDGRLDLVLGMRGRVYWCRRNDAGLEPSAELSVGTEGVGNLVRARARNCGHLAPCVADLDLDGDLDLLLGDDEGQVWWVANDGSRTEPLLTPPRRLAAGGKLSNVGARARVAVGDWNEDGYPDVFIGCAGGTVFVCMGGRGGPQAPQPLYGLGAQSGPPDTASPRALAPTFGYWFGKDKGPRLLIGDRRGFIGVLAPAYGSGSALEGYVQAERAPIDAGRCAAPHPVDWDADGDLDLVVGGEDGYAQMYERIEDNPPLFATGRRVVDAGGWLRADERLGMSQHLRYAWPCVTDLDGDGDLDLLLGQASGRVRVWMNGDGLKPVGEIAVAGEVLTLSGTTTVSALDYDQDGDTDLFVGTRLPPGTIARGRLSAEQVVYLENAATRKGQAPLFVKAVRIDAFIELKRDGQGALDADMLGISSLQPVHWNRDGIIDFLLGTRRGAHIFHTDLSRKAYPRLQLTATGSGIPTPLLPRAWRYVGARLTGGEPGIVCGTEEWGWVAWYARENLPRADGG